MPYADSCLAVRLPPDNLSRLRDTGQVSWGKLSRGNGKHHDPSRQGQQGPSCNVVPAFTRGAATVLAAEETCGMALSRQKPRPTGRLHRLAKGLSQCCPQSWSDQEGFAAFAAPQLRYPSAGIRYGSSHHPVAVGPQQLEAHDSLPTRFSKTPAGYGQSPGFLALDQGAF